MATIVLAHGAWSAAWAWKKMRPLFSAAGHEFFSPTYTGLGERAHLSNQEVDLTTHINDVTAVLEIEDLKDVTLIGHSYGGMVATGVADKARRRIGRIIYLDAFAPKDGESLFDLVGPQGRREHARQGDGRRRRLARARHAMPMPPDTAPEDVSLGDAAPALAAAQDLRAEDPAAVVDRAAAAPLHLCQEERTGRCVPQIRRTRQERSGLEILRDRRQP